MSWTGRHTTWTCGLLPALLAATLSLTRPSAFAYLENDVYDTIVRAVTPPQPSGRVVIVDVDEKSLAAIGQWPWRRDVMGSLIDKLQSLGASVVGVDVIFAERDRDASIVPSPDQQLAHTLGKGGAVLGYAMRFDPDGDDATNCVQHPIGLAVITPPGHNDSPVFHATSATCSLGMLHTAAGRSGFLNAAPDADGILRRIPVLMEIGGEIYPSLALASVAATTGVNNALLEIVNGNASTLTIGERRVPLDGKGNLLLRYRGEKRTFPYLSAADVLRDRVARADVEGRIVFLGTTALGTREVVATPLDTLFVGVEVQATVADNLLQGDYAGKPADATFIETGVALIVGLLTVLMLMRAGTTWGAVGAALAVVALWASAGWTLSSTGVFLSPLYPTLGLVGSVAALTVNRVAFERRRADTAGEAHAGSQRLMVQSLLSLTGIRDMETGKHSSRTQQYVHVIAEAMAADARYRTYLTPERIKLLASLAPLHDIGKVGVPDAILNKPGPLTPVEMAEMRRHPEYGRDVIVKAEHQAGVRDDAILSLAKEIVYTHHEKWDGSGYPTGLSGDAIPIPGRILALVDVWDAIRSHRPYHAPMSPEEAAAFIRKSRGTHFDPGVVDAFERVSSTMCALSLVA